MIETLRDFAFHVADAQGRAEAEQIDGDLLKRQGPQLSTTREHFADKQEQTTTGRIKFPVDGEVEAELPGWGFDQVEEDRIPGDPPRPIRVVVERQAVAEETKADPAMFPANGVIKGIAQVGHCGKPTNGVGKLLILPSTTFRAVDDAQLSQTPVRRGEQFWCLIGLNQGEREQTPEIVFIGCGQTQRAKDLHTRSLALAIRA